jgi:hypothetical protein
MSLGIAEFRLSNADFGNDRKSQIANLKLGRFMERGHLQNVDVNRGHEPDRFGVPASAGRASIAWGAGNFFSAGFHFQPLQRSTLGRLKAELQTAIQM